jgi:hypothetical protein
MPTSGAADPSAASFHVRSWEKNSVKTLLAKVGAPKAIGLYVSDNEVTVSQVAATPLGPVEIARHREPYEPAQLKSVLERLLIPMTGRHRRIRVPVTLGLPAMRVFFSTRPVQTSSSDPSPHVLLHEALQSSKLSIDDMAVDLIKSKPGRRAVASIVACQKKYLSGLVDTLREFGVRLQRVEPAPCALLRAAAHRHHAPRSAKVVQRVFLGQTHGLAVQAVGPLPVVWRSFHLPRGDEASALLSTCRSLQSLNRFCGIDSPLDAVMIHGRSDLRCLLDFEWLQQQIGTRAEWFEAPALDNSAVALGLAIGCLNPDERAVDLARASKPQTHVWELIPWGELAVQASMLLGLGLFLGERWTSLDRGYRAVRTQTAQHDWSASVPEHELEKEKSDLQQRVAAIRKFVNSRVIWTAYARDIPERLPANTALTSFHGTSELGAAGEKQDGKGKAKKQLVLKGAANVPADSSTSTEIDQFLESLRGHPMLKRDFPIVELADLKQARTAGQAGPVASFSVICQPRAAKSPAKQPEAGSEKSAEQ